METEVLLARAQEPCILLPLWHVCPIDWINVGSLYITLNSLCMLVIKLFYGSVSQTVVRGPQVVLGFCPCGPFRLNISPKKTEKIKLT